MIASILAAVVALAAGCDLEHPAGGPGCTRARVDALPMNAMQVIGTHNSYKSAISPVEMANLKAISPKTAAGLDYSHPPLTEQLNAGARQLELDYVYDPQGGRYASPLGLKLGKDAAQAPYDAAPMMAPGLKVMHVPDIDYRSVCPTFVACLTEVRAWSRAHRDHVPILIIMNLKDDNIPFPGATPLLPFDAKAMDAIDAEIRSVFPESELITPDKVQGKAATLREAVATTGWPKLKAARGKVMFAMDEGPEKTSLYRGARKSLEGRAMFVNVEETSPAAGYITLNEPIELAARIQAAVTAGIIVRTRADADTVEARTNDRARQVAAFASGAQYVSTDYMKPDPRFSSYEAHLPGGGIARLDPRP
ncbi:phosphatidylinositol-specific phospholipase C1-like protein [Phenylobacterium aquaticum]|uniref:phosphatidylinositol-specific phospholipase C1-like protein n=1 Tax=Phenylobacterium aquaticum TaxID=1763816 RepID=UPI0026EFCD46|nr:phosphatidylinositol-specific phospholipase C1-like protein [Phenylobacterium aquaticum]